MRGSSYPRFTLPVLASLTADQELAFNAVPDSVAEKKIPLTCFSKDGGEMRLELSNRYQWGPLTEVILHDAEFDAHQNLLTDGAYTFNAMKGENKNRFSISIRVNRKQAPTVTTDVNLVDVQNVKVTVRERNILLNGLESGTRIYIFDMNGRLIGNQVATQSFMSFAVPTMGVYNIRLVGQKAGITLRTLVK